MQLRGNIVSSDDEEWSDEEFYEVQSEDEPEEVQAEEEVIIPFEVDPSANIQTEDKNFDLQKELENAQRLFEQFVREETLKPLEVESSVVDAETLEKEKTRTVDAPLKQNVPKYVDVAEASAPYVTTTEGKQPYAKAEPLDQEYTSVTTQSPHFISDSSEKEYVTPSSACYIKTEDCRDSYTIAKNLPSYSAVTTASNTPYCFAF